MLGTIATTADGTGKKHTATIGDLFGLSPERRRSGSRTSRTRCSRSRTSAARSTGGSSIRRSTRSSTLKLTLDAQDETTSQTLGSATAPAETELFHWGGLSMTVGGSSFDAIKFTAKGDNKIKTDRHFLNGSKLKKQPIENDKRAFGGTLQGEFENLTAYNRFINGTVVPIICTWVCTSTYDTAKPFKLVLTMNNCRFDGTTPNVKNADLLDITLPFVCLDDYSTAPDPVRLLHLRHDAVTGRRARG
jgi:hypothetical protein